MNRFLIARDQQRANRAVGITILHGPSMRWRDMALAVLLFVFFVIIVVLIALFIFPPNKWVRMVRRQEQEAIDFGSGSVFPDRDHDHLRRRIRVIGDRSKSPKNSVISNPARAKRCSSSKRKK